MTSKKWKLFIYGEPAKPFLKKGTIILFDQLHSYPHWRESEFKALNDTLNESEYKFIAFGTRQACIEIL